MDDLHHAEATTDSAQSRLHREKRAVRGSERRFEYGWKKPL